jgi:hypothetical protein
VNGSGFRRASALCWRVRDPSAARVAAGVGRVAPRTSSCQAAARRRTERSHRRRRRSGTRRRPHAGTSRSGSAGSSRLRIAACRPMERRYLRPPTDRASESAGPRLRDRGRRGARGSCAAVWLHAVREDTAPAVSDRSRSLTSSRQASARGATRLTHRISRDTPAVAAESGLCPGVAQAAWNAIPRGRGPTGETGRFPRARSSVRAGRGAS